MIKNFKDKFKDLRVEGNRKEVNSSSVMFMEEDEYFDAEEMEEDDLHEEDQYETQDEEEEEQETYFMGTNSPARKRANINRSRSMLRSRPSFGWRQSPYYMPNRDRL